MPLHQNISVRLFDRAKQRIPGGVNSPVRAFLSVGGTPPFLARAKGAYLWDVDGNRFLDYVGSWGPAILGHAHPRVIEAIREAADDGTSFGAPTEREIVLAETIAERMPSIEKVRMVNSGTEATMSAIRLARAYTGRDKIVKFSGCYHGHADSFLIAAGSGAATLSVPDSPGVTRATASDTLIARYNDMDSLWGLVDAYPKSIAAIIVEPVAGNMGVVPPQPGFLRELRELTEKNGILLVFDEVMTGFRVARGGAQELYDVRPDLTTLGKIIGGGLPVGAYGGQAKIMNFVAPEGPVYQAGTLSGNPLAMAAGIETLRILNEPDVYERLEALSAQLEKGMRENCESLGIEHVAHRVGSMQCLFFTKGPVWNWDDAARCDRKFYARYFHAMLDRGIYLAPSQFEAAFVSLAHTEENIEETLSAQREALAEAIEGNHADPS
jgi:glutamate-1-semialdehyde 2,1-aminomutase